MRTGTRAPLDAGASQPPGSKPPPAKKQGPEEANPFRNLGDAMERWRANLRTVGDAQEEEREEERGQEEAGTRGDGSAPEDPQVRIAAVRRGMRRRFMHETGTCA